MPSSLKPIPLFGIGNFGKSYNVNSQKRTNLYVEIQSDNETSSAIILYPTPGLLSFISFGDNPIRCAHVTDNYLYVVNYQYLWRVANDGTMTNLGTLSTSENRVGMADNGTQVMVVDGANGYIYNTKTSVFSKITAEGFPGANTVTFLNGRFVINNPSTGQFFWSAIYDGLSWDALDYATAESNPDNLIAVIANNGQLNLFGPDTTEFWGDSGAVDQPFARIGASGVEWGLAARWSLSKFMDSLIFLRKNRLGAVQVCTLSGYSTTPVSTPEMDYIFSQYSNVENATGFSYMNSGHPFYQISFPSANESWLYDGLSNSWSSTRSSDGRHRAEIQVGFLNKSYVSDYENGNLYLFKNGLYTDDGQPIVREFISRHQTAGEWSTFDEIWIEMEAGTGTILGQGLSPEVMMQVSKDSGHTYGNEIWVPMGQQGEYRRRAVFRRLGHSRDWLFKVRVTDPIKTVFTAAFGRVSR